MRPKGNGARAGIFERVRRALRGPHRVAGALPLGEAMHPVALLAIAVLVVNDWLLKPRVVAGAWPSIVTGKLSDVAGLAFAPIVLSAALGLALHAAARLGARVDPSLSRRRLIACVVATGAGFAAVKLSPAIASQLAGWLSVLGRPARFAVDPTDLLALPALAIALWIGRDELRRVPLGRAAAILRLGRPAGPALADVRRAGGDTAALEAALDARDLARIDDALAG